MPLIHWPTGRQCWRSALPASSRLPIMSLRTGTTLLRHFSGWASDNKMAPQRGAVSHRSYLRKRKANNSLKRNTVVVDGVLYPPVAVGNNPSHPNRNASVVGGVLYTASSVVPLIPLIPLISHFSQQNRNTSVIDSVLYTPNNPPYQITMSGLSSTLGQLATRTRIEWLASLDTEARPSKNYRRTSIICTIGELALLTPRKL